MGAPALGDLNHRQDHAKHVCSVVHGSTAGTARPTLGNGDGSPGHVYWVGSVAPTNAVTDDLWWDTSGLIIKHYNGSSWDQSGNAAYVAQTDRIHTPVLAWRANMIENPDFLTDSYFWTETGRGSNNHFDVVTSITAAASTYPDGRFGILQGGSLIRATAAAGGTNYLDSVPVSVDTSKTYYASVDAHTVSGDGTTYVNVACYDVAGGITNLRIINGAAPAGSWTTYGLTINPGDWPAGTVAVGIRLFGPYNVVGVVEYENVVLAPTERLPTATVASRGSHEVHLDSTGTAVWIINFNANTVSKFGLDGKRISETALTGLDYPHDLSDDGTYLWVVDQNNNKLAKVRLSDGSLVTTYSVPSSPLRTFGVHCFGGYVWVGAAGATAAASRLHKFDPGGATFTTYNIGLQASTGNVSICDDGTNIWVASELTATVIKVNASTGAVIATVAVPFRPYGIGSDGTYIYVGGSTQTTDGSIAWQGGSNPYYRGQVVRINASSATVTDYKAVTAPVETNWKYDGKRFMYAWGSPFVGGAITLPGGLSVASQGGVTRWDTARNVVEFFPGPWWRRKGVEVVGKELWVVAYHGLDWLRFSI